MMFVYQQLTFDRFNEHYDEIYRLEHKDWSLLASGVAPHVKENFPEIDYTTRVGFSWENNVLNYQNNLFTADNFVFTDNDFFKIFSLKVLAGKKSDLLSQPYSMVLSESYAQKIFGDKNPIGKTVKYNNQHIYTITGVIEERDDFHISYDVIVDFLSLKDIRGGGNEAFLYDLGPQNYLVYLLINPSIDPGQLKNKINQYFTGKKKGWTREDPPRFWLREFADIYLNTNIQYEMGCVHGNKKVVGAFIIVAIIVLIIAGINYVNITTARGMSRFKEVSVRKIVGSGSRKVFIQFIIESVILAFLAFLVSLLIVYFISGPVFNYLSGKAIHIDEFPPIIFLGLFLIALLTGILAGIYPSSYMAAVSPLALFKTTQRGFKKSVSKQVLIVLQFTISVMLIIGAIVVNKQYVYMKNTRLGFNPNQIMVIHIPQDVAKNKEAIKQKLLQYPDILKIAYSQQVPGNIRHTSTYVDENINEAYRVQPTDPDYADLLELELVKGRNHDWNRPTDKFEKWVINETAMKKFQIPPDSVIGYQVKGWGGTPRTIIGVMKDFHFNSLHKEIVPLVFMWSDWTPKLNIKLQAQNITETITYIHGVWKIFAPGYPFDYTFVDDAFAAHYDKEEKLSKIFSVFAFLAILIGAIGMYGLASFMAKQNMRPISIRKVYGATVKDILIRFSKEFLFLVLIANVIAWPLAYYLMTFWLEKFPYKTGLSWWVFLLAGFISVFISLLTVIYNAYVTANKNPAEVLRYE
jgi:putative ABC transport system permease protein